MLSGLNPARPSLRFPRTALCALSAVTILFAAGLPRLTTDVGYRAFLGADHHSVARFEAFLARFGGGLPIVAVFSCEQTPRCESALDPEALAMAGEVARTLSESPAIARVESPATTALLVPSAFGPMPRRLVEDGEIARDLAALAARARRDPGWAGQLVSPDGRVGAVAGELTGSDGATALVAYAALDHALAPWQERGFRFHRVGGPIEFVVAGGELQRATALLIPVMLLLVGVTLLALFRSLAAAALSLATVGVAVVWTMGALGWLGWAQNSLTQTLPPLVLVIGVCDGIHIVARYASEVRTRRPASGGDRRALIEAVAGDVWAPCLMTSLTTAAGFLSFGTADLESFVRFGATAAFGVMAALVLSFTLLPLLLCFVPPEGLRARGASAAWDRALAGLVRLSQRRAAPILAVSLVLATACGFGLTRLRVDASFEELYGEESSVVQWAQFVSTHLRRPDTLEVELRLAPDADLAEPETLAVVARTGAALEAIPELGRNRSLLVPLSWTRRLLHGDDPAFQAPGTTPAENETLLALVKAFGAGVGEDGLARWVDTGRRAVRVSVESEKSPQDALRRVMQEVATILTALPEGWSGVATGPLAVVHDMIEAVRTAQLRSFATAGAAVVLLVIAFLRSVRWSALVLVPTFLPVVATLGTMGLANVALDVGSAMVAAVVLGIAVDDAIHLLEQFRRALAGGAPSDVAITRAVAHVGRALVTTSIALALGFSALALSPWKTVASFGAVSAIAILAALAAVLLVLPALVFVTHSGPERPGLRT